MLLRHRNDMAKQLNTIKSHKVVILGNRYNLKIAKEEVDLTIDMITRMKDK